VRLQAGRVPAGAPVDIQILFSLAGVTKPYCGLEVRYGDGSVQVARPGLNGSQEFPVNLTHSYKSPGQYAIVVEGKFVNRGMNSALACSGSPKTASILVFDEVAERAAVEVAQQQRELSAREAELRRLSEQIESEKKAQVAREQQLREQEQAIKAREDAAKEQALRRKEAEQKNAASGSPPAPTPAKAVTTPTDKTTKALPTPAKAENPSGDVKKPIDGF